MYQLDKDDGSEYSASASHGGAIVGQHSGSSSKMSITGQILVNIFSSV